jgi:hypothetical protein
MAMGLANNQTKVNGTPKISGLAAGAQPRALMLDAISSTDFLMSSLTNHA